MLALAPGMASRKSEVWKHKTAVVTGEVKRNFAPPQIPATLISPEERADYLAAHYWENFDFRDTTLISKPEITEQALADFLAVLQYAPAGKADSALTSLMASASVDSAMFAHFIDLTEKYLYDPNSPFRNDELYIPVLRYIVASPALDDISRIRPRYQLEMALKNRPGDMAADFVYTLADGRSRRMHTLKADYTILFFNNPDCHDCQRVKEYMAASPVVERLGKVSGGRGLAILAVYPDGDIPLWKQTEYPQGMINSYDAGQVISSRQLYDLKAMPTLYLLDREKRVILKDSSVEQIEAWLDNHCQ